MAWRRKSLLLRPFSLNWLIAYYKVITSEMAAERAERGTRRGPSPGAVLFVATLIALGGLWGFYYNNSTTTVSFRAPMHAPYLVSSTQPTFGPHFSGVYGDQALTNLSEWMSTLFGRNMMAQRDATEKACNNPLKGCDTNKVNRRMAEPEKFAKYNLFDPFVSCPQGEPLQRMGGRTDDPQFDQDGGKWLCMGLLTPPCTIFSLGSQGDFTFEESMLNNTECIIHTFDCTYAGRSIHPRHQYHQLCLGSPEKAEKDPKFISLEGAIAQNKIDKINLLKIDIEGFEYDVLSVWRQMEAALPEMVAIEIHHSEVVYWGTTWNKADDFSNLLWPMHNPTQSDLSLFFSHLGGLGYGIVSREDNPLGSCCSEFTLLRVGEWKT